MPSANKPLSDALPSMSKGANNSCRTEVMSMALTPTHLTVQEPPSTTTLGSVASIAVSNVQACRTTCEGHGSTTDTPAITGKVQLTKIASTARQRSIIWPL